MNIQNVFAKSRAVDSKVQHRSDLLMNDQMQLVHQVQTNLSNALQQLEKEKDPLHIQQLRLSVAELQAQSQKYILALKVMDKINTELIYARVELQEAIQQGHDNVNLSRKRVIWLEDKMGELCGKRKLKGIEAISDSKAMKEEKKQNDHLKLSSESQPSKDEHQFHEIKEHNEQDIVENNPNMDSVTTIVETNLITTNEKGTLNLQFTAENKREECESPTREDNESFENEDFRDCLETQRSNSKKTYLTEVEGQTEEYNIEINKSSLSSGEESELKVSSNTERHRDLASEYWQSEHHRFEYSQFANQFLEADPLSYHQVGLAVPGSFIQKEDLASVFQELPWRSRRKESEIKDVHRVALDKLAAKIHGLYYKVYDAAQLSVRSWHKQQDKENKKEYGSLAPLKLKPKDQLSNDKTLYEHNTKKGKDNIYSKTLLPPTILPITRTSWNKEYPRFASSFCKPDPESRTMTERIVDQRNLIEETKIVLYKDKSKRPLPGAANLEKKFQKMIESEAGTNTKTSGKKLRTSFKAAVAVTKLHSAATNNWNQIKPESRGKQYSGLRWERVKMIVHVHLQSPRVEERIDGARQLGVLRCGDTMVTYALKERIENDTEDRVRYEAAKALVLIGCWDEEVLACVLKYLVLGNMEIRSDLIQTIANGKNVQFVNKTMPLVIELAKVLSHFCQNPDPDDIIAFQAAVCLGQLCVKDIHAQDRLVKTLEDSPDTHIKAKALEILVKQLHFTDDNVVQHIEDMLRDSPVWSFRALACNLLISLGPNHECVVKHNEKIYQLLERRLWDDPSMEVRLTAAKSLTALGMFTRACDNVVLKLEDLEEEKRAQAAIAVGTLGLKNEKVIRLLLEMLELDSSDYVRLMIIRTFRILKLMDRRVIRSLRDRERLEGAIGRECGKALKVLDQTSALVA